MLTLTITHCGGRKKYRQLMPCQPSPVLKEVPQDPVEDASAMAKRPVKSEAGKEMFDAIRRAIAGCGGGKAGTGINQRKCTMTHFCQSLAITVNTRLLGRLQ